MQDDTTISRTDDRRTIQVNDRLAMSVSNFDVTTAYSRTFALGDGNACEVELVALAAETTGTVAALLMTLEASDEVDNWSSVVSYGPIDLIVDRSAYAPATSLSARLYRIRYDFGVGALGATAKCIIATTVHIGRL